jgi:XRE family transcriptional regulator, aerobic/anaerobic benzoate catabolism transcriptional regulator
MATTSQNGIGASPPSSRSAAEQRGDSEYLELLGNNVRAARARGRLTRKALAAKSGVSERFLAQLESGSGNASVLVLRQIARALDLPLYAILTNGPEHSPELEHALNFLRSLDSESISRARQLLAEHFGNQNLRSRMERVALIGLRGAGKSTIGKLLAEKLKVPFFELDRRIEQASGLSLSMIFDLYGQAGFRRFERQYLDELLRGEATFVVATGGSLVCEPATYKTLLGCCYTIWLQASPEEHMSRVIEQGDIRPMAHNPEAMSDLRRILAEREPLYRQADLAVNTSKRSVPAVVTDCLRSLRPSIKSDRAGVVV